MELGSPLEQGGDGGDTHAGADVAGQIDDAGAHVGLIAGNVGERGDIDGNEKKGQAKGLQHAAEHGVLEIERKIPAGHDEESGGGNGTAKGNQVASVHFRDEKSYDRHAQHNG